MPIKIFHTADIHIGMSFKDYPDNVRQKLIEARLAGLESMIEKANQEECLLFVIAGDLFHTKKPKKEFIVKCAQYLDRFEGSAVAVLPGNHDFSGGSADDTWATLNKNTQDHILILNENRAYDLSGYNLDCTLLAAPCDRKHSAENMLRTIKNTGERNTLFQIGIAHGSLEGVSPDFDRKYFPMSENELLEIDADVWLLGHTHKTYPDKPDKRSRVFLAGTPEPDGFDCRHAGSAWILEINDNKEIYAAPVKTGSYSFNNITKELNSKADIDDLEQEYSGKDNKQTLLRFNFEGRLSDEEKKSLHNLYLDIEPKFFHLEWEDDSIIEKITPEQIEREFTTGSLPHNLLNQLNEENNFEALQMAYELIREAKQ